MKQIEKIAEGAAYTCVSVGEMATLGEHILALGPDVKIPGKVFAGGALQATGAEISFQSFPVGGQTGFLHTHRNTRNFISSSRVRASFRLMARTSLSQRVASCA